MRLAPSLILVAAFLACASPVRVAAAADLSREQIEKIGRLIYLAETGGHPRDLTYWSANEDFPSLGIGHFIWYGRARSRFEESFPPMVAFLESRGVRMPDWTKGPCPWAGKAQFDADLDGPRLTALRGIFLDTFAQQTEFIMQRRAQALPAMLAAVPPEEQDELKARFNAVSADPVGAYATIDYVNFKGEGTDPNERYAGQGWGLLQVLQGMQRRPGEPANVAFAKSCARVLARRVANAPAGQQQQRERRFLSNWTERCQGYGLPTLDDVLACKEHGRCSRS